MNYFSNFNSLSSSPMGRMMERVYDPSHNEVSGSMQDGLKSIARCQLEAWGLANRRARASLGLLGQMASCRAPQDVVSVYADYWRTAFLDYADTTNRMSTYLGGKAPATETAATDAEERKAVPTILTGATAVDRRSLNGVGHREEAAHP